MQIIQTEYLKACPIYSSEKKTNRSTVFSDLKAAARLFTDMRKARKEGKKVEVKKAVQIPVIQSDGFYNTVEGCALSHCEREIANAAQKAFNSLADGEKHRLTFSPKNGEFAERVIFWKSLLKPAMTEQQYRKAILTIIHQYICIKRDLKVIRPLKNIEYPLYPDMPESVVMSKHDNMHKALMEKMNDDLYVIWDYDRKAGSRAAHDFMYSKNRDRLVNLVLWFNTSDEYYNQFATYGEYKRVREDLDFCLHSLKMEKAEREGCKA